MPEVKIEWSPITGQFRFEIIKGEYGYYPILNKEFIADNRFAIPALPAQTAFDFIGEMTDKYNLMAEARTLPTAKQIHIDFIRFTVFKKRDNPPIPGGSNNFY